MFPDFESEAPLEQADHPRAHRAHGPGLPDGGRLHEPRARRGGQGLLLVLRAPFDQWLASKAEDAGAEYICGIAVEEPLKDEGGGRRRARRRGRDHRRGDVIVAEGVNSPILCERSLGNPRPKPPRWRSGSSRCSSCPRTSSRTASWSRRARARRCSSSATARTATSAAASLHEQGLHPLGLVATISLAADGANGTPVYQMLEDFKNHPAVAPSSAARSSSSTRATWCPRAATAWSRSTCSTAAWRPASRRACA